jgi:hypothetical protein
VTNEIPETSETASSPFPAYDVVDWLLDTFEWGPGV